MSLASAHVQVHLRLARQAVLRAPLDADLRHVSGSRARAAHLDRTLPEKQAQAVFFYPICTYRAGLKDGSSVT